MSRWRNHWYLALALLTAACGADSAEPLDGGVPLDLDRHPEAVKIMSDDPCWRQERGGWHLSAGHCAAMTQPGKMTGVWVSAFEERSFFPGDTTVPSPKDWRRFSVEIELNDQAARRSAGVIQPREDGEAYLLSFVGRRTRHPYFVDCQGIPQHVVVVDRLLSARYLGKMAALATQEFARDLEARPVTVAHKHDGKWGEAEQAAIKRCAGRRS